MNIKINSTAQETVENLTSELDQYKKGLELQIFRALSLIEAEILQNLRSKSGLKVRSGSLLNSISATKKVYTDDKGYIVGEIGSEGVPYAAIHEFGGKTKAHDIEPRNKKALKFQMGGKDVFAKIVRHPGSNIPARPYLRPALAATQDKILREFGLFLKAVFPSKE